jgi:hypothetical protein
MIDQQGQVVLENPSSKRGSEDETLLDLTVKSQQVLSTSFAFTVVGNIVGGIGAM